MAALNSRFRRRFLRFFDFSSQKINWVTHAAAQEAQGGKRAPRPAQPDRRGRPPGHGSPHRARYTRKATRDSEEKNGHQIERAQARGSRTSEAGRKLRVPHATTRKAETKRTKGVPQEGTGREREEEEVRNKEKQEIHTPQERGQHLHRLRRR